MSPDQFRRYRQVGTYGAYRVVFRTVPGLTLGDGWTPDATALQLAKLVNQSLPVDVRLEQEYFESRTKWSHWAEDEARYWVANGWPAARTRADRGLLPTPDTALATRLPENERRILEPTLFGAESTRRVTAEALADAKGASSHADLCDALANSTRLGKRIEPGSLAPLPAFTRFADASMHALSGLWNEINQNVERQAPALKELARSADLRERLDIVRDAAGSWIRAPGRGTFPHAHVVTSLAETSLSARSTVDQLRAITRHHNEHGGGRRWFCEQGGKLVPLVADTGIAATDYRFRLLPLSRLAAQCGVGRMNRALQAVGRNELTNTDSFELDDDDGSSL